MQIRVRLASISLFAFLGALAGCGDDLPRQDGGSAGSNGGSGGRGGSGGSGGSGGGIAQSGFGVTGATLVHLTVAGNHLGTGAPAGTGGGGSPAGAAGTAGAVGAGAGINENGATTTLQNSIVSQNNGGNCAAAGNGFTSGAITGVGSSNFVFGDTSCPGTLNDPLLGGLQGNGGTGPTMALMPGSPAIQAVPSTGAGCAATDERGVARPQGVACDSGAYEVAAPAATTDEASAVGATGATLNGTVTPNGKGSVLFELGTTVAYGSQTATQTLAAVSAGPVSAPAGGLAPSTTYHFRVVVSTADGGSATGADKTFTTPAAPGGPGTGGPGGGSNPAPIAVSGLKLSPAAFAAAVRGGSVRSAKRVVGTRVSYRLDAGALVTFRVRRARPGRRASDGRCVAPTRKNRRARRCTRLAPVKGSFSQSASAGTNSFHFTGRIRRKALKPGSYRLVGTPKGGTAGRAAFRIVR
jgi:hypothetical protein